MSELLVQKWRQWEAAGEADWNLALQRKSVIGLLAAQTRLGVECVEQAALQLGLGRSVLYDLLQRYRQRPQTSSLLPDKRGREAKAPVLSQDREHLLLSCIHKFYLRPERPSLAALVMEAGRSARPSGRRLQSVVPKRIQGQTHLRAQGAIEGHNLMRARLPSLTPFLSAVVPNKT